METNVSETEHTIRKSSTSQQALKRVTVSLSSLYLTLSSLNFVIPEGTLLSGFKVLDFIGQGSFGRVYRAENALTGEKVAIKMLRSSQNGKKELSVLKTLNALDSASIFFVRLESSFMWGNRNCLVFEYLSKTLFEVLRENFCLSLSYVKAFAWQLLTALSILHSEGITHCDLKLENIMLVSPKKLGIKLVDFGSSAIGNNFRFIPNLYYRAPEVILGSTLTSAIDIWSVGCLLVEMYAGTPIFPADDEKELYDMIKANRGAATKWIHKYAQWNDDISLFTDLIEQMLQYDPRIRISSSQALRHPFFNTRLCKVGSSYSSNASIPTMEGSPDCQASFIE